MIVVDSRNTRCSISRRTSSPSVDEMGVEAVGVEVLLVMVTSRWGSR